jgi:hypothetical protein
MVNSELPGRHMCHRQELGSVQGEACPVRGALTEASCPWSGDVLSASGHAEPSDARLLDRGEEQRTLTSFMIACSLVGGRHCFDVLQVLIGIFLGGVHLTRVPLS